MKIVILLLVVVSASNCFGQTGNYCGQTKLLTIAEIKKKFPFDKTVTIKLVSFKEKDPVIPESDTADILIFEPEIPKTNGKVDLTKMFEVKTLDHAQAEKVMNILVNYDNQDRKREYYGCYEPHNGIILLDKTNTIIGYVEICFDCLGHDVEPDNMTVKNFCREKFDALKDIFKKAGITYGTARSKH